MSATGAEIFGVSLEGVEKHKAFAESLKLNFPEVKRAHRNLVKRQNRANRPNLAGTSNHLRLLRQRADQPIASASNSAMCFGQALLRSTI